MTIDLGFDTLGGMVKKRTPKAVYRLYIHQAELLASTARRDLRLAGRATEPWERMVYVDKAISCTRTLVEHLSREPMRRA